MKAPENLKDQARNGANQSKTTKLRIEKLVKVELPGAIQITKLVKVTLPD